MDNLPEFYVAQPLEPDVTFQFQCSRCGVCCRNVKDSILFTPFDLFRLAKHLRMEMDDVIEKYLDIHASDDFYRYPELMAKIREHRDVCIFYRNGKGCTIQDAKPQVCRLYPLSVHPNKDLQGLNYVKVSRRQFHYTGPDRLVSDWFKDNMLPDDAAFTLAWYGGAADIGRAMRRAIPRDNPEPIRTEILTKLSWLLYLNYEMDEDFLPQYIKNKELLLREIARIRKQY